MATKEVTQDLKEFLAEVQSLSNRSFKDVVLTSEAQVERLLSKKFQNPYEVLLLSGEATEEEMRKQYRAVIRFFIDHLTIIISFPYLCIQISARILEHQMLSMVKI